MLLIGLLVTALVVSVLLGVVAKMPRREIALQTAAMFSAALIFYGLVALL
jgi:hypothetical protein